MNCEEATNLMDGYLDGELDPITSQTIEQHLRECPKCDQAYKIHGSLIRSIGNATPYYKAPAELRERIQSSLREEAAEQPVRNVAPDARPVIAEKRREPRSIIFGTSWNWLALAACHRSCSHHCLEPGAQVAATWRQRRTVSRDATYCQSCAFTDGKSSGGCRVFGPAHCETVARRATRFRPACCRSCERGFSLDRGPSRLSRSAASGCLDLPKAQTFH